MFRLAETIAGVTNFTSPKIPNPTQYGSLEDIINAGTRFLVPVFLLTFGAMLLYGAFTILTARDNADAVKRGRDIIIAAIVGFILSVLALPFANFVLSLVGVTSGFAIF